MTALEHPLSGSPRPLSGHHPDTGLFNTSGSLAGESGPVIDWLPGMSLPRQVLPGLVPKSGRRRSVVAHRDRGARGRGLRCQVLVRATGGNRRAAAPIAWSLRRSRSATTTDERLSLSRASDATWGTPKSAMRSSSCASAARSASCGSPTRPLRAPRPARHKRHPLECWDIHASTSTAPDRESYPRHHHHT